LANNALAIRIIFPSVRVIQVSFNLTGLPASLGKQKRPIKRWAKQQERVHTLTVHNKLRLAAIVSSVAADYVFLIS